MIDVFQEIHNALKSQCYIAALALSLTLPDICSQVENHVAASNRTLYIDWFNKHMSTESFDTPFPGFEVQKFTGEMCYSLRCKVLHNGNTDVTNSKLNVLVDKFVLTKPGSEEYYHGYRYVLDQNNSGSSTTTITYIGIDYLCERLCAAAKTFYAQWSNEDDFKSHSIEIK